MLKVIEKVNRITLKIVEVIAVTLLCSIAIMIMLQIIFRAFGVGLQWPEEMSRFAYVGVVFLGSVTALGRDQHITVDTFINKLPLKAKSLMLILINLSIVIFSVLAIEGTRRTILSAVGVHANSLDWFQYNYIYYTVFISFCLMVFEGSVNCLLHLMKLLAKREGVT